MKSIFYALVVLLTLSSDLQKQTPEQIVQKNLDFYNQRDIDGFCSLLSDDVILFEFNTEQPIALGLAEVRKIYQGLFIKSPELKSNLLNRIAIGNKVIDHERIMGRNGLKKPLELVVIYEVNHQKISKLTIVRK